MIDIDRTRNFWEWFRTSEVALFTADAGSEALLAEVGTRLASIQEGLVFEIGPVENGQRLFVISAGGIFELAPAVTKVVEAAPSLIRWRVVPFKQARPMGPGLVRMHGKEIATEKVFCAIAPELRRISISLYFPDIPEHESSTWGEIGFTMLDAQLGEYVVMTEVGSVDFAPIAARVDGDRIFPLDTLPVEFARLREQYRRSLLTDKQKPHSERAAAREAEFREADKERWAAIQAEGLTSEALLVRYFYFAWDESPAAQLSKALSDGGHDDVSVQATSTVAGNGYSISGTLAKTVETQSDLFDTTRALSGFAAACEVELDGYSLERSADLSDVDIVVMRAQQLIESQRYDEAIGFLRDAMDSVGEDPEVGVLFAYTCAKSGDLQRAAQTFDHYEINVDAVSGAGATLWNAACTCAILGRVGDAATFLDAVFRDNPEFLEFAATDPDFDGIRTSAEFRALLLKHAV